MNAVSFIRMKDGTRDEYRMLHDLEAQYATGTADRLLAFMDTLSDSLPGYRITRLEHSLQTATRAWQSGADEDWVVSALLHDIGDVFAPYNHDEYAASILRPFVREQCTWAVQHHADFQMYYYGHHVGGDQNKRDRHAGYPYYQDCADFCELWDQESFDPDFQSLPLEFFVPMVHRIFDRPANHSEVRQPGLRVPLTDRSKALERGF